MTRGKPRAKTKLTKTVIDKLTAADPNGERHYDSNTKGFGITVYPTGRKAFFLEYRHNGQLRRMKIEEYGAITVDEARSRANVLRGQIACKVDPLQTRREERAAETFDEWVEIYLKDVEARKSKSGIYADKDYLGRARLVWGNRKLKDITVDDVERFFVAQQERGKVAANRALASVRTCLQKAWRRNLIVENVAMKVKPLPENPPRDRTLDAEEMNRFVAAVEALPKKYRLDENGAERPHLEHVRAGFVFMLATGCRRSEILKAKWEDLFIDDMDNATWRLPKPKGGRPEIKPLTRDIAKMLSELPRVGLYVIAGKDPLKPRADLKRWWYRLIEDASIEGVRQHDIRRTFGLEVARSAGLHLASKLLGHSTIRVTEKVYAPLGIEELRKAAEGVASSRKAKIIPFKPKSGRASSSG
ncbi:MAG: site-specific integrase [Myxococcota bacterium]|jgi:integrase|nr:site-specific integrase [Myxococcota bacterium]